MFERKKGGWWRVKLNVFCDDYVVVDSMLRENPGFVLTRVESPIVVCWAVVHVDLLLGWLFCF